MIAEIAVYIASLPGTPRPFRRHLGDAVGLWARGGRQADAWAPHQQATMDIMIGAMSKLQRRRTAVILGSGPLFDVPIEAIADQFERVELIDISHLATIARRLAPLANVERVWRDLAPLPVLRPLDFLTEIPELDWVVSVNLLSQIARAAPEGSERLAVDRHLDGLSSLPVPVTLVTDVRYTVLDRAGLEREAFDLLYGRTLPTPQRHWEWAVAPIGEESPQNRRLHTVFAYPDWAASRGLGSPGLFV